MEQARWSLSHSVTQRNPLWLRVQGSGKEIFYWHHYISVALTWLSYVTVLVISEELRGAGFASFCYFNGSIMSNFKMYYGLKERFCSVGTETEEKVWFAYPLRA